MLDCKKHGRLDGGQSAGRSGFQVRAPAVATLGENAVQQMIHFPRKFLMDCSSLFFPERSSHRFAVGPGEARRSSRSR
jgi:hypothetical protein